MKEKRTVDWDLKAAIEYHITEFGVEDVDDVLAQVPGEADGPDWSWVLKLKDKRFALVQGGCDYTGWDCQSSAYATITATAKGACEAANDSYGREGVTEQLYAQLRGKQPYGLYIA